ALREADGPCLGGEDRSLAGITRAVEIPRIGEVAVVGDADVVRTSPHERAHDGLREEEPIAVASFDDGEADVGRHADDAKAITGGSDRTRGVRAVTKVIVPGTRRRVRFATDARRAVGKIDIG